MKLTFAYSNVREFRATYTCPAVLNGWGACQIVVGTRKIRLGSGATVSEDCNPAGMEDLLVILARIFKIIIIPTQTIGKFRAAYKCPGVLSSWVVWQ